MEIEELFGLPAHPLVVHAAVVLVPLTALGALACLHPGVRRRFGLLVAVFAVVSLVAVWAAIGTGEELEEHVDETELVEEHAGKGDMLAPWVAVLAASTVAVVGLDHHLRRSREADDDTTAAPTDGAGWQRPVTIGLLVVMSIAAVGSLADVVVVGHSGAEATWSEEGEEGDEGRGSEDEDDQDEDEDEDSLAPLVISEATRPAR